MSPVRLGLAGCVVVIHELPLLKLSYAGVPPDQADIQKHSGHAKQSHKRSPLKIHA